VLRRARGCEGRKIQGGEDPVANRRKGSERGGGLVIKGGLVPEALCWRRQEVGQGEVGGEESALQGKSNVDRRVAKNSDSYFRS